tara:strand:+ start:317 stop:928 length:612 start_codon:yes stop_codon:yes gene_type:complete
MNKLIERDISGLWNKYENLLKMLSDEGIDKLLEEQGQRIIECTYNQKISEPYCGVGGLVAYSLDLAKNAKALSQTLKYNVTTHSIIKCSLLSEIGRIGLQHIDRLLVSDSEWHKEKLGQYFEWNNHCPKYNVYHMSLWYIQKYNINLSWDEWQTIILMAGLGTEDSKFYGNHKSNLSLLLSVSKEIVLKKEKDVIDGVDVIPF